jgi:hypothetical protein
VLIKVAEKLIRHNPDSFNNLPDSEIMMGKKSPYLTKNKSLLRNPHQLSNGLFIETNLSSDSIIQVINRLLKGCGYKETDLKVF